MRLSIIIPALNEAAQIGEAIRAARAVAPSAEIVVADGGSEDGTPELAGQEARVVISARGRARQMNAGAAVACGDTLLFLHADTRLPPRAPALVERVLADRRVVGGGFGLRFDEPGPLYGLLSSGTTARSLLRQVFTGDQAIFVRGHIFRALGGYSDIPLMEDLALCGSLRACGSLATIRTPVLVSARRHRRYGPLRVLVTGWCYQILYGLGVPPFALHRLYYGRPPEP